MKKLVIIFARLPFSVVSVLSLGWFLVMGSWASLRDYYQQFTLAPIIDYVWIGFGFSLMGFAGAIAAKRREFPQMIPVYGFPALILGIFVALGGWGITLYAVYQAIAILWLSFGL